MNAQQEKGRVMAVEQLEIHSTKEIVSENIRFDAFDLYARKMKEFTKECWPKYNVTLALISTKAFFFVPCTRRLKFKTALDFFPHLLEMKQTCL